MLLYIIHVLATLWHYCITLHITHCQLQYNTILNDGFNSFKYLNHHHYHMHDILRLLSVAFAVDQFLRLGLQAENNILHMSHMLCPVVNHA